MTSKRPQKDRPSGLPGLRAARERKGLEQTDVAERMGLARQQISRWERGETSPSVWDALELAELLGVTVEELSRTGEGGNGGAPYEIAPGQLWRTAEGRTRQVVEVDRGGDWVTYETANGRVFTSQVEDFRGWAARESASPAGATAAHASS